MADESLVGREFASQTLTVEAGAILRFCEAVGELPPRRRSTGEVEAPASYFLALCPFEPLVELLGANSRQVHASEFQVDSQRNIVSGMRLEVRSRVVDVVRHAGASHATDVVSVDDEARETGTGAAVFRARRVYAVLGPKESA